jgi:DNA-directed RNA polymerase subunit RPC12/RpoP
VVDVVDITCPECGSADALDKLALGRYVCRDCGAEFTHEDLLRS